MVNARSPAEDEALAWLQRRHSGHWTPDDDAALQAWLSAGPDHGVAWARAQATWNSLAGVRDLAESDLQRARRPRRRTSHWKVALWPAGALAVAAVSVIGWRSIPGAFDEPRLVHTVRGQSQAIEMPDGSRIELNTETQVRISTSPFCRCVELLNGEAHFTVAHGDPRPFRVAAGVATIVDVGTAFWSRRDVTGLAVAVNEGQVDVFVRGDAKTRRLDAGQSLAVDAAGHGLPAPTLSVGELTAWRQGELVFRDAPLADVLKEFARYHPVRFEIDARLSDYRLSGRLTSGDIGALLALIQRGYPAQAVRVGPDLIRVSFRAS